MADKLNIAIAGGGIGGLTLALTLHRAGFLPVIYERADAIAELGVGINILPHAIRQLADLGLLEPLDNIGIRTRELIYKTTTGPSNDRHLQLLQCLNDIHTKSMFISKRRSGLKETPIDLPSEMLNKSSENHDLVFINSNRAELRSFCIAEVTKEED